jgi:hypothetical protein
MKPEKKVKVIIIALTVACQETVKPGKILELEASEARILISGNKAKEYEEGDEKKYSYVSSKKKNEKKPEEKK